MGTSKNAFETQIYRLKEWMQEEDNFPYVKEEEREALVEELSEQVDWLYEEGANQNYSTYQQMEQNLTEIYSNSSSRSTEHQKREKVVTIVDEAMDEYDKKLEDLKEAKTWVTDSERQDVKDKMTEI